MKDMETAPNFITAKDYTLREILSEKKYSV